MKWMHHEVACVSNVDNLGSFSWFACARLISQERDGLWTYGWDFWPRAKSLISLKMWLQQPGRRSNGINCNNITELWGWLLDLLLGWDLFLDIGWSCCFGAASLSTPPPVPHKCTIGDSSCWCSFGIKRSMVNLFIKSLFWLYDHFWPGHTILIHLEF